MCVTAGYLVHAQTNNILVSAAPRPPSRKRPRIATPTDESPCKSIDVIDLTEKCKCEHRGPGCSIFTDRLAPLDPSIPVPSSNKAPPQWLQDYEARQIVRDAAMTMKLDRVEGALASLSSQFAHTSQSADTDDEASEMASGPSAQTLIERGVMAGWSP